jgi:recombination protein RecA
MNKDVLAKLKNASMLSEQELTPDLISTGSYALNKVVSGKYNGGIPIGMITQFIGQASTAKTVFGTHILREAQKRNFYSIIIDSENAYSPKFAVTLGIDPSKLIYAAPPTVEECFDTIDKLIKGIRAEDPDTPIVVFYDSLAVSPSKAEMSAEGYEGNNMQGATRAKTIGAALRKINPILRPLKVALILVNQIRTKVGVMFGDPRTSAAGGNALDYYLGVNLECSKSENIGDKESPHGIRGKVKNKKNKIIEPFKTCEFELIFNQGLNPYYGIIAPLERDGVVERNGAWYTVKETGKKFQSPSLQDLIESNDEGMLPIIKLLKEES